MYRRNLILILFAISMAPGFCPGVIAQRFVGALSGWPLDHVNQGQVLWFDIDTATSSFSVDHLDANGCSDVGGLGRFNGGITIDKQGRLWSVANGYYRGFGFIEIRDSLTFCWKSSFYELIKLNKNYGNLEWTSLVTDDCGHLWTSSKNHFDIARDGIGPQLIEIDPFRQRVIPHGTTLPFTFVILTYRDHNLYGIHDNAVYRVNTEDPSKSVLVFRLAPKDARPLLHDDSIAMESFRISCSQWGTYVFSRQIKHPTIPTGISKLKWPLGTYEFICNPGGKADSNYFVGIAAWPDTFNCSPDFDLDADDSEGAPPFDFKWQKDCPQSPIPIADDDISIRYDYLGPQEIDIWLNGALEPGLEFLSLRSTSPGLTLSGQNSAHLHLSNDGTATPADFENLIRNTRFVYLTDCPLPGLRTIDIQFVNCAHDTITRHAFLHIPDVPCAGNDSSLMICDDLDPFDLFELLGPKADLSGHWSASNTRFDPATDSSSTFWYVVDRPDACDPDSAQFVITVGHTPVFDLGPDTTICSKPPFILSAPTSAQRVLWSNGSSDDSIFISQSGLYHLSLSNPPGCSASDSIFISFGNDTFIDLGTISICHGDSVPFSNRFLFEPGFYADTFQTLSGCDSVRSIHIQYHSLPGFTLGPDTSLCDGQTSLLLDPGVSASMYLWQDGSSLRQFRATRSGLYWVQLTDDSGCNYRDSVFISLGQRYLIDLGKQSICPGDSFRLGHKILLQPGFYRDTLTSKYGCDSILSVTIDTFNSPQHLILGPVIGCRGDTLILFAHKDLHDLVWSNGGNHDSIRISSDGPLTLSAFDPFGCPLHDSVYIRLHPLPLVDLLLNNESCEGLNDGTLIIVPHPDRAAFDYSLDGHPVNTQTVQNLSPGDYKLLVKDSSGCNNTFDFHIAQGPIHNVSLGDDIHLTHADTLLYIQPTTDIQPIDKIFWNVQHSNTLIDSNQLIIDHPFNEQHICIEIRDTAGCSAMDCITIFVESVDRIFVPSVFTPNGDGINDKFLVFGDPNNIDLLDFHIFNRWGEEVFRAISPPINNDDFAWNGRWKGDELPAGVYIYWIRYKPKGHPEKIRVGNVTLVR